MTLNNEDLIQFADEPLLDENDVVGLGMPSWKVLIVDDDIDVHRVTKMAFSGVNVLGQSVECFSAYSAAEARLVLASEGPFACMFLDVVMEDEQAGLTLVSFTRDELQDHQVRIILRTGQPGYAPEIDVIKKYDINDYKNKSELSRTRLVTSLVAAVRAYQQIRMLEQSRAGLSLIIEHAPSLFLHHSARGFAQGVLMQLCSLLDVDESGFICCYADGQNKQVRILAGVGQYSNIVGQTIDSIEDMVVYDGILKAMRLKKSIFESEYVVLYVLSPRQDELIVRIETSRLLSEIDIRLIELFSLNIAVGFDNAQLFEKTEFLAYHDPLTCLPNRRSLLETMERLIKRDTAFSVLIIDIDNFQSINDGLGYRIGDALLKKVAALFRHHFDSAVLLARITADTYGVIFRDVSVDDISRSLDEFKRSTDGGIEIESYDLPLSLTFGLALHPGQGNSAKVVLQNASIAMKHGKNNCRGSLSVFNHSFEQALQHRLTVASSLRYSIEREELELHFQPQHCLKTHQLVGAEALLRWRRSGRLVSPIEFIEAAESSGLIVPLGAWVLEKACREQQKWLKATGNALTVAVNVSVRQLSGSHFLTTVDQVLRTTGISPQHLELEITESMMIEDAQHIHQLIAQIRTRGIKVALDDFGTGYSSLSSLQQLPIDKLKIDRSFVFGVDSKEEDRLLVEMIINLGKLLGYTVIAEGVETIEQQHVLQSLGCDMVQGYYYSRPLGDDAWQAYLLAH